MLALFLSALVMLSEPERLSARLQAEAGSALMGQGLLTQAREAFSRALDINPLEDYAMLGLARVSALEGSIPLASGWYRAFMSRCPTDYRAPLELGNLLLADPDSFETAGTLIRMALGLEPGAADAQFSLAKLLVAEGDTTGALEVLRPLFSRDGPHRLETGMLLASLLFRMGDNRGAREILREDPLTGHPGALWLTARTHLSEGDYLRAADLIDRCLALSPSREVADSASSALDSLAREGLFISQ